MKMFKEVKAIPKLDKIEDSIRLGQIFIDFRLMIPFERDPRHESEAKKKYPKYIVPARP
jgi:translocation protein SEC62